MIYSSRTVMWQESSTANAKQLWIRKKHVVLHVIFLSSPRSTMFTQMPAKFNGRQFSGQVLLKNIPQTKKRKKTQESRLLRLILESHLAWVPFCSRKSKRQIATSIPKVTWAAQKAAEKDDLFRMSFFLIYYSRSPK